MSMQPAPHRISAPGYPSRRPRIILIGLIALCGFFVYGYNARLAERDQVQEEIRAMRATVDAGLKKRAELEDHLAAVSNDEQVEDMARGILGLVKPGDRSLTVVKATPMPMDAAFAENGVAASVSDARPPAPVWQQWVDFFAADTVSTR